MKRILCVLLALAAVALTACSQSANRSGGTTAPTVNDLLNAETASAGSASAASAPAPTADWQDAAATQYPSVDVDLTAMSSTMVYSEVSAMMTEPDKYRGKVVRMKGSFSIFEDSGHYYFACLIADATACCSQGIEFVTTRSRTYPEDYPTLGDEITVVGVFGTYQEGGYTYCQLSDAELR